ncbi:MAG: DUF2335 domain-containing protein [Planctomycetota bacterium]
MASSESPGPTPGTNSPSSEEHVGFAEVTIAQWRAPLPPPDVLRAFGEVDASFPERILAMTEREQAHRHRSEFELLDAKKQSSEREHARLSRGQVLAFVLALTLIAAGVWLTLGGHAVVGGTIFGTTIVSLVAAFLGGRLIGSKLDGASDEPDRDQ